MDFGTRLKEFADKKYGSMYALSKVIDVSAQSLSGYVKGSNKPSTALLEKLYKVGCDLNWLISGIENLNPIASIKGLFPVVNSVGAGIIIPYDDEPTQWLALPYKRAGCVVRVIGDSMSPTISQGDFLLVDNELLPIANSIAVVRTMSGEQMVKRYGGLADGKHLLLSDNVNYKPILLPIDETYLLRRVVLLARDYGNGDIKNM